VAGAGTLKNTGCPAAIRVGRSPMWGLLARGLDEMYRAIRCRPPDPRVGTHGHPRVALRDTLTRTNGPCEARPFDLKNADSSVVGNSLRKGPEDDLLRRQYAITLNPGTR
jgi:hypothetical protein